MANPVTDSLTSWQPDADTTDTNQPVNSTVMSDGAPGDLDGELRRIKSEIRAESILKSFERWLGIKNLAGTGNVAFTFVNPTTFTVNDDFVNAARYVAVRGRMFKAYGPGGAYIGSGWVAAASFGSPNTTVTVLMADNPLNATLSEIVFGVDPAAVPAPAIISSYAYLIPPFTTPGSNQWFNCPDAPPVNFILSLKKWPIPRAGVLKNLYVEQLPVGTPPNVSVEIYINGVVSVPSMVCTVIGAPAQASDSTHAVLVAPGDLLTFLFINNSNTLTSGHLLASVELY